MDTVHNQAREDIEGSDIADDRSLDISIEQSELNSLLGKIVDSLGPPDNEIVIRYYYYYQRISDIAAVMGSTPGNIKVRLHRARKKMKKLLEERGYDYEQ